MKRRALITLGLTVATLASACSSSSDGAAGDATTTTVAESTTSSTTSSTSGTAVTTTVPETSTTVAPAPTTVAATTPATPKPPSTTAPSAPKVPTLSSVRLSAPLPSCNPGDVLTITITFRAANAAGVTVWSSYDGTLGQFPAEFGSVEVPYTCINGQILFTLQPVAEGGALGASVDLYV